MKNRRFFKLRVASFVFLAKAHNFAIRQKHKTSVEREDTFPLTGENGHKNGLVQNTFA